MAKIQAKDVNYKKVIYKKIDINLQFPLSDITNLLPQNIELPDNSLFLVLDENENRIWINNILVFGIISNNKALFNHHLGIGNYKLILPLIVNFHEPESLDLINFFIKDRDYIKEDNRVQNLIEEINLLKIYNQSINDLYKNVIDENNKIKNTINLILNSLENLQKLNINYIDSDCKIYSCETEDQILVINKRNTSLQINLPDESLEKTKITIKDIGFSNTIIKSKYLIDNTDYELKLLPTSSLTFLKLDSGWIII